MVWTILFHQGITSPSVHVHRHCYRLSGRSKGRRHARLQCSERPDANARALLPPTVDMPHHGAVAKNFLQQMDVPELSRTQRSTGRWPSQHLAILEENMSLRQQTKFLQVVEREHQRRATEAIRSRPHRFNSSPSTSTANSLTGRAEIV